MDRTLKKGFTLIELLVVIGIIGILAAIVLVAVNPGRQFAQARNTTRQSDLIQITNAVYQFASENNGNLPGTDDDPQTQEFPTCTGTAPDYVGTEIGTDAAAFNLAAAGLEDGGTTAGGTDGVDNTIVPTYIASIPVDPSGGDDANTGYYICVVGTGEPNAGRIYANAVNEIDGTNITVLR